MQQTHLPGVKPIMVGRNGRVDEPAQAIVLPASVPAAQPAVATAPVQVAPVAQDLPVLQQEPVLAVGGVGITSSINAQVTLHTKAVVELPWGFIKESLIYAFLSPLGEICISDLPPQIVTTNGAEHWQVMVGADLLILGTYSDVTHWRDSLTLRPDTHTDEEEEVTPEVLPEPEPEPVVVPEPEPETAITKEWFATLSNRQKKKHKHLMASKGLDYLGTPLVD